MRVASLAWAAALAAAMSLLGRGLGAQSTGSLTVGVATVHYDGFLPSGAVSLAPRVDWQSSSASVSVSGTYLRFESGHESLQSAVAARLFTDPGPLWRGEFGFVSGASQYLDLASFWHGVARARLHVLGLERGAWIGVSGGATSYGGAPRSVAAASAGVWWRLPELTLQLSTDRSRIADTTYTDVGSRAHWERGPLALDVALGARAWSGMGSNGSGVYGETTATIALGERTALVLGGGHYASDPISGGLAAGYLSAAVGLSLGRSGRVIHAFPTSRSPRAEALPLGPVVRLEVRAERGRWVRLRLHASEAMRVELAGDFTDWEPVALTRVPDGAWEAMLEIPSGLHRINVRLDGGAWFVPAGVTRSVDDFGSEVGIFAVP
ncbi:MAG TPA: glycogen-binding domain-containing protein [Gemmatimonadales bacterium]|nr:glycogen-binding domain-containing protein [Gemmatimonadales bacterium]